MTDEEVVKALGDKVGKEAAELISKESSKLEKILSEKHENVMKGIATKEEVEAFKADILKSNKVLEDALKAQGEKMGELTAKLQNNNPVNEIVKLHKFVEENKSELGKIRQQKSGTVSFVMKAAGVHASIVLGGEDFASIVEGGSAAALLRLGDGPVETIQRGLPFILNFVTVGSTAASALIWFDEVPKNGNFTYTTEGALKPLVQYGFVRNTASYRKAAGFTVITEEFDNDFPRVVSTIKQLVDIDVKNVMNSLILTDMLSQASPYVSGGLHNAITSPDYYSAIGAAISQLQSFFYTPTVLVMNQADVWRMKLTKGTTGYYVLPPFQFEGKTYEFGNVIVDPRVPVGNFFIGDGSVYHVDLKGDIVIRMGYNNDDLTKNQYTMVVEQYFYNYIATAKKPGFIYANFATILTDIAAA